MFTKVPHDRLEVKESIEIAEINQYMVYKLNYTTQIVQRLLFMLLYHNSLTCFPSVKFSLAWDSWPMAKCARMRVILIKADRALHDESVSMMQRY